MSTIGGFNYKSMKLYGKRRDIRILRISREPSCARIAVGVVERVVTVPHRSGHGSGGPRDGGGGLQPGAARFSVPSAQAATKEVNVGEGMQQGHETDKLESVDLVVSLHPKELAKSAVPSLEVGDVIEADIWKSRLGGRQVRPLGGSPPPKVYLSMLGGCSCGHAYAMALLGAVIMSLCGFFWLRKLVFFGCIISWMDALCVPAVLTHPGDSMQTRSV